MHWLIRPDAADAFSDRGVRRALSGYIEVAEDRREANFRVARMVAVEDELGEMQVEELWRLHSELMQRYRRLRKSPEGGEAPERSLLHLKHAIALKMLERCEFCERRCRCNRRRGELGFCGTGAEARLSSEFIHMGEEACMVPSHTIFFTGCNFYCVYCQNWTISRQVEKGTPVTGGMLAEMVERRRLGDKSRNVNLVGGDPTPSMHVALEMLCHLRVNIPVVWNSNMYMSEKGMSLLEGAVDVYLADFKYGSDECALELSRAERYFEVVTRNLLAARVQGAELLIRHLVLPGHVDCCTKRVLEWVAENLGNSARLNIMPQYRPEFEAYRHRGLTRRVSKAEMREAMDYARELGLWNLEGW